MSKIPENKEPFIGPLTKLDTLKVEAEKSGRSFRIQNICKHIFLALGFAFAAIAAGSMIALEVVPMISPLVMIGFFGGLALAAACFGVWKLIKSRLIEPTESKLHSQMVDILMETRGKIPEDRPDIKKLFETHGKSLETLTINGNENFPTGKDAWTPKEINDLFDTVSTHFTGVKNLRLQHFKGLTAKNVAKLEKLPLESFDASASDINDAGLAEVGKMKKLKVLHLRSCRHITGKGLDALEKLPLNSLTLASCRLHPLKITDATIKTILEQARKKFYDEGFEQLKKKGLPQDATALQEAITKVQQDAKEKVTKHEDQLIDEAEEKLTGQKTCISANQLEVLYKLPKLKTLYLSHVDDSVFQNVLWKMNRLEDLEITYSPFMTGAGFDGMRKIARLHEVRIDNCKNLNEPGIVALAGIKSLRKIDFMSSIEEYAADKSWIPGARKALSLKFEEEYPKKATANSIQGSWTRK